MSEEPERRKTKESRYMTRSHYSVQEYSTVESRTAAGRRLQENSFVPYGRYAFFIL
jgi:hypothetical protein